MPINHSQSIEQLEADIWSEPEYDSHLVLRCHALRKKALRDFSAEDLRIMIGQNIGLKYLMPLAIEQLQKNILLEGHFYEGDVLNAVLSAQKEYWEKNPNQRNTVCKLVEANELRLKEFDTTEEIRSKLFDGYQLLKNK